MSTSRSSGLISVGTVTLSSTVNYINGVSVISDSTNTATVTIYDSADGLTNMTAAKTLAKVSATTTTGSNSLAFTNPIRCENGITVVVSGTGSPTAIVLYGGTLN
jgi:hypothetical protein